MNNEITYLSHEKIDKQKWDLCISTASNGIVFAYSWYLDEVFSNWNALILNDYEAVFPITQKSKFGLGYFFNPIFALQLGVFSVRPISSTLVEQFLQKIPTRILLIDIQLNFGNHYVGQKFKINQKTCQYLSLNQSIEEISKNYSTNLKRNLVKGKKNGLKIIESTNTNQVVQLFQESKGEVLTEMKPEHYIRLTSLLAKMTEKKIARTFECWVENEQIASACFSVCNNRIIYIKGGSTAKGRELGAMHFLMNHVIQLHAQSEFVFDFGGSSIPQVARFNHSFGAVDYAYQNLVRNKLFFWR